MEEVYSRQSCFQNVLKIVREATRKAIQYINKTEDSSVQLSEDEERDYKRALATASNKNLRDYLKNGKQEFGASSLDTISLDEQINLDCELNM